MVPRKICPKLVVVKPESEHELLFRYACLHRSIPVSAGYGRRLRFLVGNPPVNPFLLGAGGVVQALRISQGAYVMQSLRSRMGDVHGTKPILKPLVFDFLKWAELMLRASKKDE